MALATTPPQTVGPFYHFALSLPRGGTLVAPGDPRARTIRGRVLDGAGAPVADAMIEVWQANRAGRYAHAADDRATPPLEAGFTGFGRVETDAEGRFEIVTVKPGPVPGPGGTVQAPHLELTVFARGVLRHLVTRMYFPDEEIANAADPVLASLADPARAHLLVARPEGHGLRFDIHLQGERETPFFAV
jgi:protocatechuate 3,4-dioxygenase alpha subunit